MTTDALGRPVISAPLKAAIAEAFATIPDGKRGALLLRADTDGNAVFHVAAKINGHWKVAAGVATESGLRRPIGFVAVVGAW